MTIEISTHTNVTGRLAQLLADEKISILHGNYFTASFDVKNRVLRLPTFKEEISKQVYVMLIAHEVGHARWTPLEGWHDATAIEGIDKSLLNIVEDARIEKLIRRLHPGLYSTFIKAYAKLHASNFFNIEGLDVNQMGFVNRLNLYFKGETYGLLSINFNEDEMALIDQVMIAETWDDVLQACRDIQKYLDLNPESAEPEPEDGDGDGEPGEGESQPGQGQGGGEPDTQEHSNDILIGEDGEGQDGEESQDGEAGEAGKGQGGGQGYGEAESKIAPPEKMRSNKDATTEEAYRNAERELLLEGGVSYVRLDDNNLDLSHVDIMDDAILGHNIRPAKSYLEFKKAYNNIVLKMISEFNLRKNAHEQKLTQEAQSGRIDPTRLSSYRFTDDIFKRYGVTPRSKNHGFLMMMDNSGSMGGDPLSCVTLQCMLMAEFCRRVKVPFQVYGWTSAYRQNNGKRNELPDTTTFHDYRHSLYVDSTMNKASFERHMGVMWEIVQGNVRIPMGGTPSGSNAAAAFMLAKRMKAQHKLEKMHVILMADEARISSPAMPYGADDTPAHPFASAQHYRLEHGRSVHVVRSPENMTGGQAILHALRKECESVTYYGVAGRVEEFATFCREAQADYPKIVEMENTLTNNCFVAISGGYVIEHMLLMDANSQQRFLSIGAAITATEEDHVDPQRAQAAQHDLMESKKQVKNFVQHFMQRVA